MANTAAVIDAAATATTEVSPMAGAVRLKRIRVEDDVIEGVVS
jgi:hypothetical protein